MEASIDIANVFLWATYGGGSESSNYSGLGICIGTRIYIIKSASGLAVAITDGKLRLVTDPSNILKYIIAIG